MVYLQVIYHIPTKYGTKRTNVVFYNKYYGISVFGFIFLLRFEKDCCSLQSCLENCESVSASATQYLTVDKSKLDGELMELKVSKQAHA